MSYYFFLRDSPLVGLGLLIHEVCFLHHTRHTTVGRTPLDEWLGRHRDLHLATHNTHNRQTSMPPVGFEPTISASERPKTYALDRAATGTGLCRTILTTNSFLSNQGHLNAINVGGCDWLCFRFCVKYILHVCCICFASYLLHNVHPPPYPPSLFLRWAQKYLKPTLPALKHLHSWFVSE